MESSLLDVSSFLWRQVLLQSCFSTLSATLLLPPPSTQLKFMCLTRLSQILSGQNTFHSEPCEHKTYGQSFARRHVSLKRQPKEKEK